MHFRVFSQEDKKEDELCLHLAPYRLRHLHFHIGLGYSYLRVSSLCGLISGVILGTGNLQGHLVGPLRCFG